VKCIGTIMDIIGIIMDIVGIIIVLLEILLKIPSEMFLEYYCRYY
jgi:hypothetical protein